MAESRQSRQVVVAMKGHPGTGKSTLARAIAASLRCPLLDKDDVRDCTLPLQPHLPGGPSLLNDLSYSVLRRLLRTQLSLGLDVVVDSPLSRRAHLDDLLLLLRLRAGAAEAAEVVVVECRPGDEAEWRRRVEERGRSGGAHGHKPATWEDLQRLIRSYDGCWDYDVADKARKMVVDTTGAEEGFDAMVDRVVDFVKSGHAADCAASPASYSCPLLLPRLYT